jgi:hypothetical protein
LVMSTSWDVRFWLDSARGGYSVVLETSGRE